jgi:hypothetical protein
MFTLAEICVLLINDLQTFKTFRSKPQNNPIPITKQFTKFFNCFFDNTRENWN